MPIIVSTVHDPTTLVATCRQFHVPAPEEGCIQLEDKEVSGWIVRLPGLHYPIVCNTLTGLIAYHPSDNGFHRYACVMHFLFRYYAIQAHLRQAERGVRAGTPRARPTASRALARVGR